jgi:hypothetical protein
MEMIHGTTGTGKKVSDAVNKSTCDIAFREALYKRNLFFIKIMVTN